MAIHLIKRRNLIAAFGGVAVWPLTTRAQQPALPVVGSLYAGSPDSSAYLVPALHKGLGETGYFEGRNVAIDYRWAYNETARLSDLAADLVRRQVAVIAVPGSMAAARAAKAATSTIPIVAGIAGDPVASGLVASLSRPGGNVTVVNTMNVELGAKRLGILAELVPRATRLAVLVNPKDPTAEALSKDSQAAAAAIGREVEILQAASSGEIDAAFARLAGMRAGGLLVAPDPLFFIRRFQLVTLAARHAVPAIYSTRDFVHAGGFMSYGADLTNSVRLVGIFAGRILRGEKPADMPVLRASKFELVINLQTAKTIGMEVPPTLIAQADEVIE